KTSAGYTYAFDRNKNDTFYCENIYEDFYRCDCRETSYDIDNLREKYGLDKSRYDYLAEKYDFLKSRGYFKKKWEGGVKVNSIDKNQVEIALANLSKITFEVTDACNLDCDYCGYGNLYANHDPRENRKMDVKVAKNLLNYLRRYWESPRNLSRDRSVFISFYGGEPLLNFTFIKEIVEYVKSMGIAGITFDFQITTNGLLLDKYMGFLKENDFSLTVSLDGDAQNNSYRKLHNGKGSFSRVFNNLKKIRQEYPFYFENLVNINSVLHDRNDVDTISDFIMAEFGKLPAISELNSTGIAKDKVEVFSRMFKNRRQSINDKGRDIKAFPEIKEMHAFMNNCTNLVFQNYNDVLSPMPKQCKTAMGTCIPFSIKMYVTVNGKILPCETIGQNFDLGHAGEEDVNLDAARIAREFNNSYKKVE
ncbi:MAG: radical SAM peptide maturase, partial [bacterium]|nr:radical SAM peptide maturase [bacterium]